jgi:hypothetical protein
MSADGDRYAELITPAFTEGLKDVTGVLFDADGIALVGMMRCQQLVTPLVEAVNWEDSGLPPKTFGVKAGEFGERDKTPREFAKSLATMAFTDAYSVIRQGEIFVASHESPVDLPFGQLLINSKKSLLTISELNDPEKSSFVNALEFLDIAEAFLDEPIVEEPIKYGEGLRGEVRLEWSDQLNRWIHDYKEPDRGCPANKVLVGEVGHRQTLTHFFFEKLVTAMYPVS